MRLNIIFKEYAVGTLIDKSIAEYLDLQNKDIVCVAGAGGKTSTIRLLKDELIKRQQSVLITTTTKMFKTVESIVVRDLSLIKRKLNQKQWVITGKDMTAKIGSWDNEYIQSLIQLADITLIEADGAKRLPFKMPNNTEPVYLEQANKIVYLVGMSAIGQELKQLCRSELLMEFLHKRAQDRLTKDDIIKVLLSKQGAQKATEGKSVYIILNQVDNLYLLKQAVAIARAVHNTDLKVAISCYKN